MSVAALFSGFLLLVWLSLGLVGWLVVTYRCRPRASLPALVAALIASVIGGILPALLGWRTFPALFCGLLLALVGSSAAAWQTMSRTGRT